MPKLKPMLLQKAQLQDAEKKQQRALKEKYHVEQEGMIIVEKSNMVKWSVRTFAKFVQLIATIVILALALIGLICLLHPNTREQLSMIGAETIQNVLALIRRDGV